MASVKYRVKKVTDLRIATQACLERCSGMRNGEHSLGWNWTNHRGKAGEPGRGITGLNGCSHSNL